MNGKLEPIHDGNVTSGLSKIRLSERYFIKT
jgi:hypothetical protein